jgi:hypothetical protein
MDLLYDSNRPEEEQEAAEPRTAQAPKRVEVVRGPAS